MTIVLISYQDLPDFISVSTHIDHHSRIKKYNSKCTSQKNWFDLAGIPCLVDTPEPLNTFESIRAILTATFEEEPLETYFWIDQMSPLLLIFWGQMWVQKAEDWILTTQGLDNIRLSIADCISTIS